MSKDLETISELVFQVIGAASMCWSETPKGTFDTARAESLGDDALQSIQKIIERAKPARKEMTASTEFTTWDRKTKIVKTWESESDPGFNRGIDEYERALTNALYGDRR